MDRYAETMDYLEQSIGAEEADHDLGEDLSDEISAAHAEQRQERLAELGYDSREDFLQEVVDRDGEDEAKQVAGLLFPNGEDWEGPR